MAHFPRKEGGNCVWPVRRCMIRAMRAISTSLLIVVTVNQTGTWKETGTEGTVSVTKAAVTSNLSAMGSRYEPRSVFCSSFLATIPSRASVIPARMNTIVAALA